MDSDGKLAPPDENKYNCSSSHSYMMTYKPSELGQTDLD